MPRIAGSPYPMEMEDRIEDFLADMREIATGGLAESVEEKPADVRSPAQLCLTIREQDRRLYEYALAVGMRAAGMVAFSVDSVME